MTGCQISGLVLPVLALILAAVPTEADACSYVLPPLDEMAKAVAADGVLIQGTLIQAFDASKQQPEIVRADQIFIGDGKPRDFVIYRSKQTYQEELDPNAVPICGGDLKDGPKEGHKFDRLVLLPAKSPNDGAANGRWSFHFFGSLVDDGRGLDMLVEEAVRLGRFQSRPPRSSQWAD